MANNNVTWEPPVENFTHSHLSKLIKMLPAETGLKIDDWQTLQRFAIDKPENFWQAVIDYAGIKFQCPPKTVTAGKKLAEVNWLPGATLNFAENLLAPVLTAQPKTDRIVCYREDGQVRRYSNATLIADVAGLSAWLRDSGVRSGDRVAGILGHGYEAIVGMLATACVGGIWSSASPDFGVEAIVDRFDQIKPSVLIVSNGYTYNGKRYDKHEQINALGQRITCIKKILVVDEGSDCSVRLPEIGEWFDAALHNYKGATLEFTPVPSNHPVYILFSSGTTGRPKCIVHGTGGILLNHASELLFHADLHTNDRFFYFTTCGWMMWNWQISGLMANATLITYDGSPSYPSLDQLWSLCAKEGISHFGTSAKFLASCRQQNLKPSQAYDLSSLKMVFSTGSPLLPSEFDWFYKYGAPKALLGSIIGGTDICGCFLGSNPLLPVRRGEIQAPMLGKDIAAFNEAGQSVKQDRGELVCRNAIPSMPVGFWNDAHGKRYQKTYFQRFPGVWAHGDFIGFTPSGGAIVYGRSDTTLNPGGVRIGTAEIYRQVEIMGSIADCLVAGRPIDGDEEVVLLVKLNGHKTLNDELRMEIKTQVRIGASPRHVPRHIIQVPDIPYSRSGKKVEIAVAQMLRHNSGKDNVSALANPEALPQIHNALIDEGLINQ